MKEMLRIKKSGFWRGDRYFCAHCRKRVGFLDRFCGYCGIAVEWKRCPHCDYISELMVGDFCQACGATPIRGKK